jgi:superfamily II DNA or RNA helicase
MGLFDQSIRRDFEPRELRDYQEAGIDNLRQALADGHKRIMFQLPTGAGKTATAAAIIRSALGKGKRIHFTVPALSLITQTIDSFRQDGIYDIGVMQGIHEMTDKEQPVQICSVQTLTRRSIPKADLVIIDEAHVMFQLYDRWFNDPEWANVPIIGLSATPWTKGLGKLYSKLVVGTTTQELIERGILSPFRVFAPSHPDLSDVKIVAGDYDQEGLGKAMNKARLVADIVETWLHKGEDRPTLIYCVNRAHAQNVADAFNAANVPCGYMDGTMPVEDRDDIIAQFRRGDLRMIANVGVLTTGVDLPFISCLILARPTKSEMLFVQIMGRGLRKSEGKKDCLILDHSDTTSRLGFCTDIHHDELNDGKKRVSSSNKERDEPLPKECPACTFLRPAKMKACPNCGFEPKPLAGVRYADGDLVEVNGKGKNKKYGEALTPYEEKEKFYRELMSYAQFKGYKRGWAYHKYVEKYNTSPMPTFDKTPLPWTSKTESMVKHLQIKSRKRKEKQGAFR